MTNRVFVITVKTNGEKVKKILDICHLYLENRQNLIIKTDSIETACFIDDLLWKSSPDSFLPHTIEGTEVHCILHDGLISCFNLTKEPLLTSPFAKIYEFDDQTSVEKQQLSEERYRAYKKSLISIASY